MRLKKSMVASIAATAAATLVATVTIGYLAGGAGTAGDADQFSSEELRGLLLPAEGHPAGQVVEVTFEEASARGMFGVPGGMQVEPASCVDYLSPVLTDETATVNGWMQADPTYSAAKGIFVSWVAEVRGGAAVAEISDHALTCRAGQAVVSGYGQATIRNAQAEPLSLDGAETMAITQTMDFDVQPAPSSTTMHVVALGELLIMTIASDPALAERAVTHGYERAVAAGLA